MEEKIIKEKNAIIRSYNIDIEYGRVCMGLILEMDEGVSKGFLSDINLDNSNNDFLSDIDPQDNSNKLGYLGYAIKRILNITEKFNLKDIIGCAVRVKCTDFNIIAIGHIYKDDWFNPLKDLR